MSAVVETPSAEAAPELRAALDEAGYRPAELRRLLGGDGAALASGLGPPPLPLLRLEAAGGKLAPLVRLLVLAEAVDERELPVSGGLLTRAGVAGRRGDRLFPFVRLLPRAGLLLACDVPGGGGENEVIPVYREAKWVAGLTPGRRVASALDVGTGGGYLALHDARYAERVVATDINPRALAFTAFNAALNGIENVEVRRGSFFEPVERERFELVTSNPPYAISPASELVYRDAGLERDDVSGLVVRGAAAVLAPGGFAVVTASWIVSDDLLARPREWLGGLGCDAWIFHFGTESALAAAVAWNEDASATERPERVARWLDYYAREGIESIAYGVFVLRSGATEPWLRVVRLPRGEPRPAAAHVERMFRGVDLADRGSAGPAPGVSLRVRRAWIDGSWCDEEALLTCDDGIPFREAADGDADHLRRLVELGLLEPAG